jgi:hypothetical protein
MTEEFQMTVGYLLDQLTALVEKTPRIRAAKVVIEVRLPDSEEAAFDGEVFQAIANHSWNVHDSLPGSEEAETIFKIEGVAPEEEDALAAVMEMLVERGHGDAVEKFLEGQDA